MLCPGIPCTGTALTALDIVLPSARGGVVGNASPKPGPSSFWSRGGSGAVSAFRKNVEKRWLLENMDGAFLVLDEIVDGG